MIESINFSLLQKSLDAVWLRQRVISNNIANIDTPGFKSQDVKFEELLKAGDTGIPDPKIITNDDTSIREDGNNVDIDKENIELYRTQIQYEYLARKLTDEFSNIRMVLTEGRG